MTKIIKLLMVYMIMIATLIVTPAFAGDGDGTGGGQGNPLSLTASTPAQGQQNISTSTQIKFSFNKNVINMSVKDNNSKCFSMTTASGEAVPIQVIMADDQMEPEKKREIIVKPKTQLKPGTTYKVTIASSLRSKSGVTLGKPATISFTTVGAAQTSTNSAPAIAQPKPQPVSKTEVSQTVGSENTTALNQENNQTEAKPTKQESTSNPSQEVTDNDSTAQGNDQKTNEEVKTVTETETTKDEASSANKTPDTDNSSNIIIVIIGLGILAVAGYFWTKHRGRRE